MILPFSADQFLDLFKVYNEAIWPFQILLNLAALVVVVAVRRGFPKAGSATTFTLSGLWIWMGVVYHLLFFTAINPAAYVFGSMFIVQGLLFCLSGVQRRIAYRISRTRTALLGSVLVFYGLLGYPLLGMILGHAYPASPTFGAPCPTTIFTFGVLLWGDRIPRHLLVIPALWSVVGFSAALTMGIWEDAGLLIAGLATTTLVFASGRRPLMA